MQRKAGLLLVAVAVVVLDGSLFPTLVEAKTKNIIDVYRPEVFDIAVLRNQKPVVVFFASPKCSICMKTLDRLETKAQEEYSENLYFARVDIDKFPELAESLGVSRGPTVRLYNHGRMNDEIKGLVLPSIYDLFDRANKLGQFSQRFKTKNQG